MSEREDDSRLRKDIRESGSAAGGTDSGAVTRDLAETLLRKMYLARKFEENVQYYFSLGMIHGTTHLGIGEEATTAGSCTALLDGDDVFATHRGHGAVLSKGMDPNAMMAEIFGKATGICKGHGGSMHLADPSKGIMGTNGIVGADIALACGAALFHQKKNDGYLAAAFFGDGATNEGVFHESMNLASVWRLPMLFLCINNTYGMSTHISKVMRDTDLTHRAFPYGMRAVETDGNDVLAVYEAVRDARQYVIDRGEPVMVVEHTYRISGHSKSDGNLYRTKAEIASWRERDPIARFSREAEEKGWLSAEDVSRLEKEAAGTIEQAVRYAIDSPYPEVEELAGDVYAE